MRSGECKDGAVDKKRHGIALVVTLMFLACPDTI